MKIKAIALFLALGFASTVTSSALLITDFGEESFTVNPVYTNGDWLQQATTLTLSGNVGDYLSLDGSFTPVDIGGASGISLTGWVNGENPSVVLTFYLYDSEGSDFRIYTVATDNFGSGSTTVTLTEETEGSTVTEIGSIYLEVTGLPSDSLSFTFENLQAIPEPSVYALSAVVLGAAAWLRRRRKR